MENKMNRRFGIWLILVGLIAVAILSGIWAVLTLNDFGSVVFPTGQVLWIPPDVAFYYVTNGVFHSQHCHISHTHSDIRLNLH